MPMSRPSDDGKYEVHCAAGHVSTVTVDNVKFELLFEMGLDASTVDSARPDFVGGNGAFPDGKHQDRLYDGHH
ncbi:MAG: hypothetical protein L0H94_07835 [Nitrospira sp.]|nr:hypothetical protein [Nitrospira sp.]